MTAPAIARTAFTTSRLLEFCTVPELTKLVGFDPVYWPSVVVKEISDNALDACEEAGIAPEITIAVSTKKGTISVTDNGPGIPPDIVARLLDYKTKTSSREAYVAPTRGAQGNALQALLAMPFALDGKSGETTIEARSVAHHITFTIDPVRREPKIEHVQRRSLVQSGTRVTLHWPNSADRPGFRVAQPARRLHFAVGWQAPGGGAGYRSGLAQVGSERPCSSGVV